MILNNRHIPPAINKSIQWSLFLRQMPHRNDTSVQAWPSITNNLLSKRHHASEGQELKDTAIWKQSYRERGSTSKDIMIHHPTDITRLHVVFRNSLTLHYVFILKQGLVVTMVGSVNLFLVPFQNEFSV